VQSPQGFGGWSCTSQPISWACTCGKKAGGRFGAWVAVCCKGIKGGKGWKVESFWGCFQVTFALVEEALARPPWTCHHE
jgi:hypothetical protein